MRLQAANDKLDVYRRTDNAGTSGIVFGNDDGEPPSVCRYSIAWGCVEYGWELPGVCKIHCTGPIGVWMAHCLMSILSLRLRTG